MSAARTLDRRIGDWEDAGLLTRDQVAAIHEYEAARPLAVGRGFGRLITIVGAFAVLLIAAGVAQLVAANWDDLPDGVKLGMVVAAVIGLEVGGWRLHEAGDYPRTGVALILLGYLLYGSGIHLVAQTYHRPLDDPSLLLLWFLPGLPLAHLARSGMIALTGVAVGFGALGIHLARWLEPVDEPLLWAAPYMAIAAVLLAAGGGAAAGRHAGLAAGYGFAGAATATVLLYLAGFRSAYGGGTGGLVPLEVPGLVTLATLAAVAVAASRLRAAGPGRARALDGAVVGGTLGFAWLWALVPGMPWQVGYGTANLALLGMIVWLVAQGLLSQREALVNLGVVVFAIALLTRYVEIGIGMLGGGLSFFGTGTALLAVAIVLERTRRRLLAGMAREARHAAA